MSEANDNGRSEFADLVRPHLDAMLRTAERMTRDTAGAEDLVQDALLKAFRFFHRFESGSNFKAWIFKILMNAFVNSWRKNQRRVASLDAEQGADTIESSEPDAGQRAVLDQRNDAILEFVDERVKAALMELPDHLRAVFLLVVVEDMKYREVSDVLDCPVGTVMSRLFRARAMLKERLTEFAREAGYEPGGEA